MTSQQAEIAALFENAARLAAESLQEQSDPNQPVVNWIGPEDLTQALELELPAEGRGLGSVLEIARKTLHFSVRTGHPRFVNQLFGGSDPAAIVGEWITALSNTSMYTYEAAPVGTVVEVALIKRLCDLVGFPEGEGVFAPGGSISNLMSVLSARQRAFPHVKQHGLREGERPVMFASAESHYSIPRAGIVCGLGHDATISVPVDEVGRMRVDELERLIEEQKRAGRAPFYVAATAGTTVAGAFDPIGEIAAVARRHGLWLHIDGSYGGSALLSKKYSGLLAGSELADSMTWNPHKMMGIPLASSATLMREPGHLEAALAMNADYLLHGDSDPQWNLGDRSLQCGRRVDALKLWFAWQVHGDIGFERRVDGLFDQAQKFRQLLAERPGFRLIRDQEGPNVCFRYLPPDQRDAPAAEWPRLEQEATIRIRSELAREGSFLINYASLDGAATFRLVASNPNTTDSDLTALLDAIESKG